MKKTMKKNAVFLILCILFVASFCFLHSSAAVAEEPSVDASVDAENFGKLNNLMFWEPREKLAGFRNIEKLYNTREIERSDQVYALCADPIDLSGLSYKLNEKTYTFDDFMTRNRVTGIILVKDDRILAERYELGNNVSSRWISFSVAKSVVSMLTGAAIKDGYISSVDDKITDYLPRLKGSAYEDVSIKNILQMASGVEWNEDYADPKSDVNNMPSDIIGLLEMLGQKKRVAEPGSKFNYNTAETHLVGAVVRGAIGNNLSTYLTHKIWQPMGMESDASWLLHGPAGGEMGGCCINAILRDYARIGIFAMHNGVLPDGTEVLPKDWMKGSTTPSSSYAGYGYLWWLSPRSFSAIGIFGQSIFIYPEQNLVIAMHSAWNQAGSGEYRAHRQAFLDAAVDLVENNK